METKETIIIKRFLILLLIATLLFICFNKCDQNNNLESENDILKDKFEESQAQAKSYIDEYNKTKPLILILNNEILKLKKLSLDKQTEYLILDKKYNENIKIVNKFSINDMQLYFNNRYGTEANGYTTRFDTIKQRN